MQLDLQPDAESAARRAVELIAAAAADSITARGCFHLALSGGSTPVRMFELLAGAGIDWPRVSIYQVDERIAPPGDAARNLTTLQAELIDRIDPPPAVHPMPVDAGDLAAAAAEHAGSLPRRFDLVHLGLGVDGHTASLVPGDPVLRATAPVAITGLYQGHRRMTLTIPVLDAARRLLYLVTGADKQPALARLLSGDDTIPAGRVASGRAIVVAMT